MKCHRFFSDEKCLGRTHIFIVKLTLSLGSKIGLTKSSHKRQSGNDVLKLMPMSFIRQTLNVLPLFGAKFRSFRVPDFEYMRLSLKHLPLSRCLY